MPSPLLQAALNDSGGPSRANGASTTGGRPLRARLLTRKRIKGITRSAWRGAGTLYAAFNFIGIALGQMFGDVFKHFFTAVQDGFSGFF